MSFIDVSELMGDPDFVSTITRRRPTTTLVNEGEAVQAYADAQVIGSVQPAKTSDAQFLPEGVRLSDTVAFFTAADVSAGSGVDQLPDLLIIGSITYKILHLQDFRANGYVRAVALRLPAGTAGT